MIDGIDGEGLDLRRSLHSFLVCSGSALLGDK
jgi:hypothetical protein